MSNIQKLGISVWLVAGAVGFSAMMLDVATDVEYHKTLFAPIVKVTLFPCILVLIFFGSIKLIKEVWKEH